MPYILPFMPYTAANSNIRILDDKARFSLANDSIILN